MNCGKDWFRIRKPWKTITTAGIMHYNPLLKYHGVIFGYMVFPDLLMAQICCASGEDMTV